jgi:septin family protein
VSTKLIDNYKLKRSEKKKANESTTKVTEFPVKTHMGNDSLYLTMIDTPGGVPMEDKKQKECPSKSVHHYINTRLNQHAKLQNEIKQAWAQKDPVKCKALLGKMKDERVHLVLYFFTSNRCKTTDIAYLEKLSPLVNVIPVISMADQYSHLELKRFKKQIMDLRSTTNIRFFNCQAALQSIVKVDQFLMGLTNSLLKSDLSGTCPPFAIMNPQLDS